MYSVIEEIFFCLQENVISLSVYCVNLWNRAKLGSSEIVRYHVQIQKVLSDVVQLI